MIKYRKHPDYNILCGSDGNVYNLNKTLLKSCEQIKNGYIKKYIPTNNRPNKSFSNSRNLNVLIFEAFNHKVKRRHELIKHIDGNKNNNKPENLVLINKGDLLIEEHKQNIKMIRSYNPVNDEADWHHGIYETAKLLGVRPYTLQKALKNGYKCKGKYWFYRDEAQQSIRELRRSITK